VDLADVQDVAVAAGRQKVCNVSKRCSKIAKIAHATSSQHITSRRVVSSYISHFVICFWHSFTKTGFLPDNVFD